MKLTYVESNHKFKLYRDYKTFDNNLFQVVSENGLRNLTDSIYTSFEGVFSRALNHNAPINKKIYKPMKIFSWVKLCVMRTCCAVEWKTCIWNWRNYKKQRNFFTNLFRKTEKNYFPKLDIMNINDSEKFWKIIKPFFSGKSLNCDKIMVSGKNQIKSDETTIAVAMKIYH